MSTAQATRATIAISNVGAIMNESSVIRIG
jgi:hypothetical protein